MTETKTPLLPLNLHLQHLLYLRELQRRPSVSAAARALHVSQPALSQALGEMERRLGLPLFEREGRKRHLTRAGSELLRFAQDTLARAEELERRLEQERLGQRGNLRVGMIDAASLYILPRVVRDYRRERPEVELSLSVAPSEVLLRALSRFELDLVFAIGPLQDARLQALPIRREALLVYAPPESRGRDLRTAEWILYPPQSRTRALIDAAMAARGLSPRVRLESGSPEVLRQLVSLGLGWSVLPEAVAEGAATTLRRVYKKPFAHRELLAFRRKDAPPDPLVDEFIERARTV
jgi:DNA-binding transcriptional LysR family regulator